jgi:hypothetical protein
MQSRFWLRLLRKSVFGKRIKQFFLWNIELFSHDKISKDCLNLKSMFYFEYKERYQILTSCLKSKKNETSSFCQTSCKRIKGSTKDRKTDSTCSISIFSSRVWRSIFWFSVLTIIETRLAKPPDLGRSLLVLLLFSWQKISWFQELIFITFYWFRFFFVIDN